ncbi:acyltransferase family protein [Zoogloea sp.]|uniref:acyltransferase family protein n=1 Tax=Zoogloea sp. TaxID=49181 RepID=UPI0035AEE480
MAEKDQRWVSLDVLRGLAVLPVLLLHASEVMVAMHGMGNALQRSWLHVLSEFDAGRFGVALFFIVSGFVVPFSLPLGGGARVGTTLAGFALRRAARLYPAYWVSILLSVVCIKLYHDSIPLAEYNWHLPASNVLMLQRFVGWPDLEGIYWTLQIELVFYVLCAGLFALGRLHGSRVPAWLVPVCVIAWWHWKTTLHPVVAETLRHLPLMFMGVLLRRVVDGQDRKTDRVVLVAGALFYCVGLPFSLMYGALLSGQIEGPLRAAFPFAGALVVFACGVFVLPLRTRWLAWVGRISYSVYLVHPAVMYGVAKVYESRWGSGHGAMTALFWTIGLTLAASAALHQVVEKPGIRVGSRLVKRWFAPQLAGARRAPAAG